MIRPLSLAEGKEASYAPHLACSRERSNETGNTEMNVKRILFVRLLTFMTLCGGEVLCEHFTTLKGGDPYWRHSRVKGADNS